MARSNLPPETTILSRPVERKIEYGFVDRCAAGVDSAVERFCERPLCDYREATVCEESVYPPSIYQNHVGSRAVG